MGGARSPSPLSAACIALILALLASTAHAQVFPASFEAAQINLASSATYYEDRAGDLTVEQAIALHEQGLFRPNPREDIHFGMTRSSYWIHFHLDWNSALTQESRILEIAPPENHPGARPWRR